MDRHHLRRLMWGVIAVVAWVGVLGQLYISPIRVDRPSTFIGVMVEVFSYWTIQTNVLVALACTLPLLAPTSALGRFFARPIVRMALVIYIATTGVIYFIVLANLWNPQGFARIVDILLHYVTPVLYPLCWLLFDEHRRLEWHDLPKLLVFPLLYVVYSLIRGALINFYPYLFIDVNALGLPQVLINSAILAVIFLLAGTALVAVDRVLGRQRTPVLT